MYTRLLKAPNYKSFFLFGPRGTGKTTWVREAYPNALYLDLLESTIFNDLLANPQRLDNLVSKAPYDFVIIDEVQRIPDLLHEVHRLIENKKIKFVLTGSSARKLRRKGVNLLAGRALTLKMYPLTAIELGADFDLEKSLSYGHLPLAYLEPDPLKFLNSYVSTYLEEEVFQEGLTRNLSGFSRFLETASFSQGSVLNTAEISREALIDRKLAESYFKILEDLLIAYRLPVFTKKAKRRLITHPKFYFFDTGVYNAVKPSGPLDRPENNRGIDFETLFLQNLMAVNDYFDLGYKIYYYRTKDGTEVDFIAYGDRGLKAFEIKSNKVFTNSHTRALKTFIGDYPMAKGYLIYGGNIRMYDGKIDVIPMDEALKTLPDLLA